MDNTLRKAAEMAFEALNEVTGWQWAGPMRVMDEVEDAIEALRQALAQPEQSKYSDIVSDGGLDPRNKFDAQQEPVAWLVSDAQGRYATIRDPAPYGEEVYEPLYAAPLKREQERLSLQLDVGGGIARAAAACGDQIESVVLDLPKREWVGLTEDDVAEVERWVEFKEAGSGQIVIGKLVRYIELKLRSKNNAV